MAKDKSTPMRRTKAREPIAASIPVYRKLLYSAIVVLGFFGFFELALRALDLGRPPILGHLRFGYDTGIPVFDSDGIESEGSLFQDMPLFEEDVDLLWRPIPNTPFTGPKGFRKPEPQDNQSDESLRVLVLGDSCSFLGKAPYPNRLADLVQKQIGRQCAVFNASCPGYSSHQGLLRLEQCLSIKPHIVVFYFGWNDHWLSLNGCTDRQLFEREDSIRQAQSLLSHFRVYWLLHSLTHGKAQTIEHANVPMRVPVEDYVVNVAAVHSKAQQIGCHVVYVTAPSGFDTQMPEWANDFFARYYRMTPQQVSEIPGIHAKFNDALRTFVLANSGCSLCDLETEFEHDKNLFRSDTIHLTEDGHEKAAESLASIIKAIHLQNK